jgi:myo-inositol-1(or 4)-monophosphatase
VPDPLPPIFLATAVEAVVYAGAVQMANAGERPAVEKKGTIDLVTEIDRQIERDVRRLIADRFPEHTVLGEEYSTASDRAAVPEFCWIFDPLDGTTNFAHGLPIFCSSLALEIDGVAAVAAVYDPNREELFTAERGLGAWLNGAPIRVSSADALIDSLLCTGFPYNVQQKPDELVGLFAHFLGRARAVRRLGSAAIDLCYVAAGRFDGFWELHLGPWDIAAGALIVSEAGGSVTSIEGERFRSRDGNILASNGRVHTELLGEIVRFREAFRRSRKGTH